MVINSRFYLLIESHQKITIFNLSDLLINMSYKRFNIIEDSNETITKKERIFILKNGIPLNPELFKKFTNLKYDDIFHLSESDFLNRYNLNEWLI
jgi:hypothetical protein